ncbi:MAG: hypothetical protein C5B50_29160 [Verrucomicrobia bacterium]|nr:MAG: hypothetical protein C5B50_29160 [Verrucomicrobiota bacterium]
MSGPSLIAQPSSQVAEKRVIQVPTGAFDEAIRKGDLASVQRIAQAILATNAPSSPAEVPASAATPATPTNSPVAAAVPPSNPEPQASPLTNTPSAVTVENGTNGLLLNFQDAPLNLVLDRLSDAAGFIINKTTDVRGSVSITSKTPVTKDEAVDLLNSTLKKNGYAVTRKGRILTIVDVGNVKTADLEITTPYSPDEIEASDEVVTAIIHIRYANAQQLMSNLEVLLPTSATLTANESANTLLMVATKTDIKRMLKIIDALDTSIASVSSIKVMPLKYADAKDTATLITQLFAPPSGSGTSGPGGFSSRSALFSMFSGGRFGGPGGPGGSGDSGGKSGAAATHVTAVADDRSNSLVVSAPADLLSTIGEMVDKIDQPVADETELRRFPLVNADPTETADELTQLFPDPTANNNNNQNNNVPFFFRFSRMGGGPGGSSTQPNQSERAKKLTKVVAIPEPRTRSVLVTASKTTMVEIAKMIAELDADRGRPQVVQVFDLHNIDPQEANNLLRDLFMGARVGNPSPSTTSQPGMLGNNNPLTTRETQQQQNTTPAFGGGTGSSGGGMNRPGGQY